MASPHSKTTKTSSKTSVRPIKLLVANRSEIACRIFQTAREMGIHCVGTMVPGDEQARHVTYADELIRVPSYLDIPAIVKAAQAAQVSLVHPGYGFLSERPSFVEAVEAAGMAFIGPRAQTMRSLGEKIAAKEFAEKAKVPTLPWAKAKNLVELKKAATRIGFPLLIKASAGGGGKGMRKIDKASDFQEAAENAATEAQNAFGDPTVFLEKWVDRPRHVEVQIFGDGKGGGVHFYERECSLQRRHQKIWEEAPAPNLSDKTRKRLYGAALKLVQQTKYRGAGTVEFLVDSQEGCYFLEVNARLQVEHPITEAINGVDLVRLQILQALGSKGFELVQNAKPQGHAIEVRICAEDPLQGFVPSPGEVRFLRWPTGMGIRVESGIELGQKIEAQFDNLLAKIIVHSQTREQSLARLRFALEETVILGLGTNQAYLKALLDHPAIQKGQLHTGFLEKEFVFERGFPGPSEGSWLTALRQAQGASHSLKKSGGASVPSPWSHFGKNG